MANTVEAERQRLRARLTQLDDERGRITYALTVLDRIDNKGATASGGRGRSARSRQVGGRPGGTLDRAVATINHSDRSAWTPEDLIVAMRESGWAAQVENEVETVRSALSRATRQGLITRVAHGMYGPLRPDEPPRRSDENDGRALTALSAVSP